MRFVKEIKRDTILVVVSVLLLTISTLKVSYSAFFAVKSLSTVQQISTGTLNVSITGSTAMSSDDLMPATNLPTGPTTSEVDGSYATLVINNTGTINSDFTVNLSYDTDNLPSGSTSSDLLSFNYLKLGVYDVTAGSWIQFDGKYYADITSDLTSTGTNTYTFIDSAINSSATKTYRIYVWLSSSTPVSEIGKLVYLKVDVSSSI